MPLGVGNAKNERPRGSEIFNTRSPAPKNAPKEIHLPPNCILTPLDLSGDKAEQNVKLPPFSHQMLHLSALEPLKILLTQNHRKQYELDRISLRRNTHRLEATA